MASFRTGALLSYQSGNIYGTTYYGGTDEIGSLYKLSSQPVGEWAEEVIYSFQQESGRR